MRLKTSYELLDDAQSFLASLEKEIESAKSTIDLQFYTFEADAIGQRVARALVKAKKRGIRVRFLQDYSIDLYHNCYYIRRPRLNRSLHRRIINKWKATKELLAEMQAKGIGIKLTNPLGFFLRKALHRDHKKMVVIDSGIPAKSSAYIGGMNLCEHNAFWNDFMVRMSGEMVSVIQEDFNMTWENKNEGRVIDYNDGVVLTDSRKSPQIMPYLKGLIDQAQKIILAESPYLYGKKIKECLIAAVRRGIDVRLIVPLRNNRRFFSPRGRFLKQLVDGGVHVYQFEKTGGMTHAKAFLIDDTAVFGSSNFNEFLSGRSCEISIATKNKKMVKQLREKLDKDMLVSQKID